MTNRSARSASSLRIVVLGYVVRGPLAGPTWHHLQYVLGLKALGHDVWYVEDSGEWPSCYDPQRQQVVADPSYGLAYTQRVFERAGVGDRWAFFDALEGAEAPKPGGGRWHGPAAERIEALCRSADVVVNVSGINPLRPWLRQVPVRVLVDTDPVFTQVDILQDPVQRAFAESHTAFFSFAECIGLPGCTVPDDGLPWQPTRQPVALDAWTPAPGRPDARWSTVMLWDSYDVREWAGRRWGMKSQEMERVLAMPQRCGPRFELALGSPTAPHDRLRELGWHLVDPIAVTSDPWVYQDYIRGSKAEFSVAKHGYVASGSGWFSERSASYMALGRPVVVQDTGFGRVLPTGRGLFAFNTFDEAVDAVEAVDHDYARHCAAARELVAAHFDAPAVLASLLDRAHAGAGRAAVPAVGSSPASAFAPDHGDSAPAPPKGSAP